MLKVHYDYLRETSLNAVETQQGLVGNGDDAGKDIAGNRGIGSECWFEGDELNWEFNDYLPLERVESEGVGLDGGGEVYLEYRNEKGVVTKVFLGKGFEGPGQ